MIAVACRVGTVLVMMTVSSAAAPVFVPIEQLAAHLGRPVRVAILARRSKDDPDTKSLATQINVATTYLASLPAGSWTCDLRDVAAGGDVFRQIVSAWKGNGQHSLLRAVLGQLGAYDLVLVYRMDRLARKTVAALQAVETMRDAGVRLYSVTESLDTADPSKYFQITLMMMLAQQASDDTSARIKGSKSYAKQVGGWRGGAVLYGHQVATTINGTGAVVPVRDAHGYRTLAVDPAKAVVLRWAVERILQDGWSLMDVVHDLNERQVPSPRNKRTAADGTTERIEWSTSGLQRILRNPGLLGYDVVGQGNNRCQVLSVGGKPHRPHPPVLPDALWKDLQQALSRHQGPRRPRGRALLRGLVVCEALRLDGQRCGKPLYGPSDPSGTTASYSCQARTTHHDTDPRRCTGNSVSARWLEQMVTTTARLVVDDPRWRVALQQAHAAAHSAERAGGGRDAQLAVLEQRMAVLRSELHGSRSERRRSLVQGDLDALDQQIEVLEHAPSDASRRRAPALLTSSFIAAWDELDSTAQHALLADLVQRVEVLPATIRSGARSRTFNPARVRIVLRDVGVVHLTTPVDLSTGPQTCPNCDLVLDNTLALGAHRRRTHGTPGAKGRPVVSYPCPDPTCDRTSTSPGGIARHHEAKHSSPGHHPCVVEGCGRIFGTRHDLATHTRATHTDVTLDRTAATCDTCAHVALNRRGLRIHEGRKHKTAT